MPIGRSDSPRARHRFGSGARTRTSATSSARHSTAPAKTAKVKFSADNHVKLFLNGKEVGSCDEWQDGAEADLTKLLKPKENELVAEVWNDGGPSGFVLKLAMTTDKGETKYVVSDESWSAGEKKDEKGIAAKKIAKYGDQPWGNVFAGRR